MCRVISVSVTFQCGPHLLPFLCDELTTTFGATSNDSFQRHWLFDLFLPSLTVVVAGLFSVFHVVVSFLYSCTFGLVFLLAGRFTFSLAVFLFCLPVLQRRYFITGAVIFILASLLHMYSGVFNMNLCAVMMRFLYNNALIIMPRIYCFLAARSLSGSYIKW